MIRVVLEFSQGALGVKLTYDPQHNVAYIYLQPKTARVQTLRISDELNVDVSPDGRIYGIELLNANQQLAGDETGKLTVVNEASGRAAEIELPI